MAHGVVSHTKSAADHIQTGIQSSAKAVAGVPGSLVNAVGSGVDILTSSLASSVADISGEGGEFAGVGETPQLSELQQQQQKERSMKREKSLATLESLCQRTQEAREKSQAANRGKLYSFYFYYYA